jgi:isopentenyldiphosphate isomerase
MPEEMFEIVDEEGLRIGLARRSECHADPRLIHPSVHVLVVNRAGELFLQKRAWCKDIHPGKWDTSVGGHVQPGEDPESAAHREMEEELGVAPDRLSFAYRYLWRSPVETELVRTYTTTHEGPFVLQPEELDDGRFWTVSEIESQLRRGIFTPNFEAEFERWQRASHRR